MDEQLAAIYGTGMPEEEDLAKTASAELLVKLAEEEGVDLNDFSDEEIAHMITNLQGEEKTAGEQELDDESQTKLAEADYLGRVMAHAMVQELGEIEKQAADPQKQLAAGSKAGQMFRGAKAKATELAGKGYAHQKGELKNILQQARGLAGSKKVELTGTKGQAVKSMAKSLGKASPTILAAGGLGYGAYRGGKALFGKKEKKGSALDKLAEARAYEILAENGWVDEDGGVFEPDTNQEKVASQLDFAVEAQALQMLEQAGYPVQWNEE